MLVVGLYPAATSYAFFVTDHGYVENKGQIMDQHHHPNHEVLFLLNNPGLNVQLKKNGFSYDVYKLDYKDNPNRLSSITNNPLNHELHSDSLIPEYYFQRIDITLEGANPDCQIIPSEPLPDYFNYFTAFAPPEGIKNVRQYSKITYQNIYTDIDLEFFTNAEHGYKYNFVIHPGGKLKNIRFSIEGPDLISSSNGNLKFTTRFGDLEEMIPETYYLFNDSRIDIKASFIRIKDNVYGFSVNKPIPKSSTLVIDPTAIRLWGTYYGGMNYDYGETCAIDKDGDVFLAGATMSTNNIASAGSYQDTYTGNFDGFLAKFNAAGQRLWGTYIGDTGYDAVFSCIINKSGYIYISGATQSTSGIASPGAHQKVFGGGISDCFIEKFNQAGDRLWGTYYGGNNSDDNGTITSDNNGFIFLSGTTKSDTGIATPGCYQQYINHPSDIFLAKFDSNGIRLWGTYYGGDGSEQNGSCVIDGSGNVYIDGLTNSQNNFTSPGAFQSTFGGGINDAFLVKFSNGGQRLWATYYGGFDDDAGGGCSIDSLKNIIMVGRTNSVNGISSPGCYQPDLGSNTWPGDGFIVKFDSAGQRLWGTYYGGSLGDNFSSSSIGWNNEIFISGHTNSPDNISSPNSYQPGLNGVGDAMLVKFNAAGQRIWGTYYGGNNSETSYWCRYKQDDTIYITGLTYSTESIASQDSYQEVYGGGGNDAFLIKFLDCWHIDTAGPITGSVNVCKPSIGVNFSIPSLAHAVNYIWTLPPGFNVVSGVGTPNISVNISNSAISGLIRVKGLNKCGDAGDSAVLSVTVKQGAIPAISGPDTTCAGPGKIYTTDPGKTNYQWSTSSGGIVTSGGATNVATVSWNIPGIQQVYVIYTDTNGCQAPSPTQYDVLVNPDSIVNISITASSNNICSGTPISFTAIPVHGGSTPSWQWKVNGVNTGPNSSVFTYTPLNNDIVKCVMTSSITTCITNNPATSNSITMIVNPQMPVSVSITSSLNPVCAGNTVLFTAHPVNEGSSPVYQWKVNGVNAGTNSSTFTYIPINNDQVSCVLTSSLTVCVTNNPATSNTIVMQVDQNHPVSLTVSASLNPVCAGNTVLFTALPVNPGLTPVYQWKVNGINAGTNSSTFTYIPVNNDQISCVLTSSLTICVTNNPATSNVVTMSVNPNYTVSVSITAPADTVCQGTSVQFTAHPVNEGLTPIYQWEVNGVNSGANLSTFSYTPVNNDVISCVLTSSYTSCTTNNPATSNVVTMTVFNNLAAGISITAIPNPFCSGSTVSCSAVATNGGFTPSYQWKVNGVNAGTNASTYSFVPLQGDIVQCVMNSSLSCITNNPVTSNTIVMNALAAPSVSFTLCFDSITTINAAAFKLKGGVPIGGVYSGPGVNSSTGVFTPSSAGIGTKTITYFYQNSFSCANSKSKTIIVQAAPSFNCGQNLIDIRDNKVYSTVQLGTQCWMQKNLNYGTSLQGTTEQTDNCINEKYCYSDNIANCTLYGGLYQWDELMAYDNIPGAQGLCPPGWHVPTQTEWNTLFTFYQQQALAGKPLQDTIIMGFRAKETGVIYSNFSWSFKGFATIFWTSTPSGTIKALSHGMNLINFSVSDYSTNRSNAFAVRCLKD
jgi:uncharacterized protein (TIGR02145 family)